MEGYRQLWGLLKALSPGIWRSVWGMIRSVVKIMVRKIDLAFGNIQTLKSRKDGSMITLKKWAGIVSE